MSKDRSTGAGSRVPGNSQPPVKIYNAVYSSVQVYECMVRGIAVMRRRNDSYVNATQILKVAGVEKGRRTKILEKEVLPGIHEIVQGGYGKYQGTWIPLERGRDIALQYGVAPLLGPLFDFQPSTNSLGALPVSTPTGAASPCPISASSSYSSIGMTGNYAGPTPSSLAPPPIMPGSALRLLNQGRAQGLFTPTTAGSSALAQGRTSGFASPAPYPSNLFSQSPHPSQTPPPVLRGQDSDHPPANLKRNRSEADIDSIGGTQPDVLQHDPLRPSSTDAQINGEDNPSPAKRLRTDEGLQDLGLWRTQSTVLQPFNGASHLRGSTPVTNGVSAKPSDTDDHKTRFSSKPIPLRSSQSNHKDSRRTAVLAAICQRDDPGPVLDLLREISFDPSSVEPTTGPEVDIVLDDQGHTSLHIAASLGRLEIVNVLIANGADVHRGNFLGETPLIRACIATSPANHQCFNQLLRALHHSIRTLDTARKSVLHHVVSLAGVKGRAVAARYYLDEVFLYIAKEEGGDFRSIVDLQDEHGDTALNIAARVGNRSLVRTLLDVGANRILPNKLGLRPGDFGVETEELSGGPRPEDILSSIRSGPTAPVQKSQDVVADMTAIIQNLSDEFQAEIKTKQDALDLIQAHLRAATRGLSEQRKQIQSWQGRCGELDQINQRVRNVQKALSEEDLFDWTGRTDLEGNDARETAGSAFQYRGAASTMMGAGTVDISFSVDSEPPLPAQDSVGTLVKLRRMKLWHVRIEELVKARLKGLQGATAEKEYQCKKIVALCTGLPIDKVEEMLENLVIAVESESQIVDLGRVSGFMQKVRDGII